MSPSLALPDVCIDDGYLGFAQGTSRRLPKAGSHLVLHDFNLGLGTTVRQSLIVLSPNSREHETRKL